MSAVPFPTRADALTLELCSSNTQTYEQLLSKKPIAAGQCLRKLAPFLLLELRFIWNHSKKSFLEPKWIEEYLLGFSKESEPSSLLWLVKGGVEHHSSYGYVLDHLAFFMSLAHRCPVFNVLFWDTQKQCCSLRDCKHLEGRAGV